MIRRLLTLACATAALTLVAADRAGARADPKGPAVQPFKPTDLKWVRNATGTQERAVLFGDPSKPEPCLARDQVAARQHEPAALPPERPVTSW